MQRNMNCGRPLIWVLFIGLMISGGSALAQAPTDPYRPILDGFSFPENTCDSSATIIPDHPLSTSDINRFNRKFKRRKQCEDQLMVADRQALNTLVRRIGGSADEIDGDINWTIPQDCNCSERFQQLMTELQDRDQSRITKYQADYYKLAQAIRKWR